MCVACECMNVSGLFCFLLCCCCSGVLLHCCVILPQPGIIAWLPASQPSSVLCGAPSLLSCLLRVGWLVAVLLLLLEFYELE